MSAPAREPRLPRKPLPKNARRPRRRLAGCPVRGCKRSSYRRSEAANLCRIHLIAELDKAARALCMTPDALCFDDTPHVCVGGLQWAHRASRRYFPTRWAPDGADPLCAGRHAFYTNHPDSWARLLVRRMGASGYGAFLERAHGPYPDFVEVYKRLVGMKKEKSA